MGSNIILSLGALVLFGTFLGSSNRLMIGNNQIAAQNEFYVAALSLAQSVLDEAKTKAFDQKTVNVPVSKTDSLTGVSSLGKEAGETVPTPDTLAGNGYSSIQRFNDIDDYHGYKRLVNTPRAEGYTLSVSVGYASATYPDSAAVVRTFCKKMAVTVNSRYIPQPLIISYAFTY